VSRIRSSSSGQATVELVALLPLLAVVAAGVWQVALLGHAVWASGVAARVAARAEAVRGEDVEAAALRPLPSSLRPGAAVRVGDDGGVRVAVRVPAVVPGARLGSVASTARFEPQR
jgi:Flp pilus assembly protein TadG